jgi:ABC-2 type transport system ATP-binding protein
MTTHNLDEAERLCDRVGIFQQKLLTLDSPSNLRDQMFGRRVVFHLQTMEPAWVDLIAGIAGAGNVEVVDNKLVVSLKNPEESNPVIIRALVTAGAQVQFVGEIRHSLEQIYLEMVGSGDRGQA